MAAPRVLIAGLGDTGVLTAVALRRARARGEISEVVGVSTRPGLVSGQELGMRLAQPEVWARDYRHDFSAFRALAGVRTVHGSLTGVDPDRREVELENADGERHSEPYDLLVVATGVSNGFWRRPDLQTSTDLDQSLRRDHERLRDAGSIAVIGGGAAAITTAWQSAHAWPGTVVDLYFPGERGLPSHHPEVWSGVRRQLEAAGVRLHPGHRAELPEEAALAELGTGSVAWSTGQPDAVADAVLWAIGRVRPNTDWLPGGWLDEDGFVRVTRDLRVQGDDGPVDGVFAIGDVAATDPLRSSARNAGHRLLARNLRATLSGGELKNYRAPKRRWGSVLGVQPDGLRVYAPNGREFRIPRPVVDRVLMPLVVNRGFYGGVRTGR